MMQARARLIGAAALLFGAACGERDAPSEKRGVVNAAQAQASVRSTTTGAIQAVAKNDGPGALTRIVAGAIQAQSIVAMTEGTGAAVSTSVRPQATCACTSDTCTYVDCGTTPGSVLDGSFTWTPSGDVRCAGIRYEATTTAGKVTITLECDLHASDGTLTGFVESNGVIDVAVRGDGVSISDITWSSRTDLNVTYDAAGPTGGSAEVSVSSTVDLQTFSGKASVLFR